MGKAKIRKMAAKIINTCNMITRKIILFLIICNSCNCFGCELDDNIKLYKCETKRVSLSNIQVLPGQIVVDQEGKSIDVIHRGNVELHFAVKEVSLERPRSEDVRQSLDKLNILNVWKNREVAQSEGLLVGLTTESIEALLFLDGKWWLVRLGAGYIGFVRADLAADMKGIKIATIMDDENFRVTDDVKVINAFEKIMKTMEFRIEGK